MAETPDKKRGPIAGPETTRTSVLIEPHLIEWGKRKSGGLSELVRRLLREAYEAEQSDQITKSGDA